MSFPQPPNMKPPVPKRDTKPLVEYNDEPDTHLSGTELKYIMQKTLKPHNFEDSNVIGFIKQYLLCRDARQAATEIGLEPKIGNYFMQRKDVHETIEQIISAGIVKSGINSDELVEKVKEIAYVDPGELFDEDGVVKENMRDIPPEVRRSIKSFEAKILYDTDPNGMRVKIGKLVKVSFWDKLKSSELLGRDIGKFKETKVVEHGVTSDMRNILLESVNRAEESAREAREREVIETSAKNLEISGSVNE